MANNLHRALKTQVIRDFQQEGARFVQVRLQHGKGQFVETLHVAPSTWTSSGFQLPDLLHFLGFQRSPCAFLNSECYARIIQPDLSVEAFAEAFKSAYGQLNEAIRHLEACGILIDRPEGWGFFFGKRSERQHLSGHEAGGDGHTGSKSQRMKESEDQYFKFVFSWLEGPEFK